MSNIKSDFWRITCLSEVTYGVVFEEEITAEEAKELFIKDKYEDIIDQDIFNMSKEVIDVEI